ncbi:hypothetical protein ACFWWC_16685 [Streptomyces sp. NPDC058642]|uniref:hypothetical protein n=1 Tax=Streptomyces sp. NPDC058642 TaxID=3346572 RepID=UPI00365D9795
MPTTSLARRAGARTAALAALTVALGPLSGMATADAVPLAPGDNGTVKIHTAPFGSVQRTPYGDPRDEPKVCKFYIDAANFDPGQEITWNIVTQPPVTNGATLSGELLLPTGAGHTLDYTLPDGQYKLTWNITGGSGAGKHKVFKVDCVTPPGGPGGPNGGPPAGGGGIARDQAFAPVAGAAAVGVAAAGGVVWFRLRRRPHGA